MSIVNSTAPLPAFGTTGHPDCPCIDVSEILRKGFSCDLQFPDGTNAVGIWGSDVNGFTCKPLDYGSNQCLAHDAEISAACQGDFSDPDNSRPAWCPLPWCFVDPDTCRDSYEPFYRSESNYGLGDQHLYYSYSTCNSTAEQWRSWTTTQVFETYERPIMVAIPDIWAPFHYKFNEAGEIAESESPEYYDDFIPWTGWLVDYFNAVVELSNIKRHRFIHRSGGSSRKGYDSTWTDTVADVGAGVADTAISTFWVTSERLGFVYFTTPIALDRFSLWIPQPELSTGTFRDNAEKLLLPFTPQLWFLIIAIMITFALISAVLSPKHYLPEKSHEKPTTTKQKLGMVTSAFTVSVLDFTGGAVNYNPEASTSQKFVDFAFGIFIFIVAAAYTANLAAFLTLTSVTEYISSIDDAIAQNVPLCAPLIVKADLITLFPAAVFIFYDYTGESMAAYDRGECKAMVQGYVDMRGSPSEQEMYCARNLVRVGNTLMEKPMAFPANEQIVGGLSRWIAVASAEGVTMDSFLDKTPLQCSIDIAETGSEGLQEISAANMVLPLALFFVCAVVGLSLHVCHSLFKDDGEDDEEEAEPRNIGASLMRRKKRFARNARKMTRMGSMRNLKSGMHSSESSEAMESSTGNQLERRPEQPRKTRSDLRAIFDEKDEEPSIEELEDTMVEILRKMRKMQGRDGQRA